MSKEVESINEKEHKWWHWVFVYWRKTENFDRFEIVYSACRICSYEKKVTQTWGFK